MLTIDHWPEVIDTSQHFYPTTQQRSQTTKTGYVSIHLITIRPLTPVAEVFSIIHSSNIHPGLTHYSDNNFAMSLPVSQHSLVATLFTV